MKTIIVTKYGSVFRTRADLKGASASGEQGETEGIIRHLAARGDCQVVYFGQYRGEKLCHEVVNSDLSPMKEVGVDPLLVTGEMQEAGWDADERAVRDVAGGEVVGMICVNGYAPTFSHVDNPRGATVQCAALNYCAPVLALLERLKIPRICVNNDPRTYPRDQEMSYWWEWARPRALLDQCDNAQRQVVGGRPYRRVSVHARVESWAHLPEGHATWDVRTGHGPKVVAHAHIQTGIRNGCVETWRTVLNGAPPCTNVYGAGWEHFPDRPQGVMFMEQLKPAEVPEVMRTQLCMPVVSHTEGFYTGKPYLLVSQGCVPLLAGVGSRMYDPKGLLRPCDSPYRVRQTGDYARIYDELRYDRGLWEQMIHEWREACAPDWSALDRLVDRLLDGTFVEGEDHGGYFPCS